MLLAQLLLLTRTKILTVRVYQFFWYTLTRKETIMSETMYPGDNVGKDGTVYPTVGGLDAHELTSSELAVIKAYLAIV